MGVAYNPKNVMDGLCVCIDPLNKRCYRDGDTSLYDLGGNHYTYSVNNGPTLSDGLVFSQASTQYIAGSMTTSKNMTIITIAKSITTNWDNYGILGSARSTNGYIMHTSINTKTVQCYFITSSGGISLYAQLTPADITIPTMYAMSTDGANNHRAYINSKMVASSTGGLIRTDTGTTIGNSIGRDENLTRYGSITLYYHAIYNRQLSDEEVAQVYNINKGRFGL